MFCVCFVPFVCLSSISLRPDRGSAKRSDRFLKFSSTQFRLKGSNQWDDWNQLYLHWFLMSFVDDAGNLNLYIPLFQRLYLLVLHLWINELLNQTIFNIRSRRKIFEKVSIWVRACIDSGLSAATDFVGRLSLLCTHSRFTRYPTVYRCDCSHEIAVRWL